MFDLHLLSASHGLFLLASFTVVFVAIHEWGRKYVGSILAISVASLTFLVLPNTLALGLAMATAVLLLVGRADESRPLPPAVQLFWQLAAGAAVASSGWVIPYVSNPLGPGVWHLGFLALPATIAWVVLMMNALNWLDGVDGLASSVAIVAFITLAAVSLLPATQDSLTLTLALIGAGSFFAFFLHNAPPAKVYLGTTGSWFVGLFLALAAARGGGKVATAALVLALPLLDAGFVIIERLLANQKPWAGDKRHLHFRLTALGWSPRSIVAAATAFTAILGIVAVTAQTLHKLWALAAVALLLAATILVLSYHTYDQQKDSHR